MDEYQTMSAMSEALIERGLIAPDVAAAELAMVKAGELPPENDPTAFIAPETPERYKFAIPDPATHSPEQERAVKQVFHEFGIPAPIASEIDRQYIAGMLNPPNALQTAATQAATLRSLHRIYGDDKVDEVLSTAVQEFAAMTTKLPQLREMAEASGLADSLYLISSLYNISQSRKR